MVILEFFSKILFLLAVIFFIMVSVAWRPLPPISIANLANMIVIYGIAVGAMVIGIGLKVFSKK